MIAITLNGASFSTDFVQGFASPEAFIKQMDNQIPDWFGDSRNSMLNSVWNEANGKSETPIPDNVETVVEPTIIPEEKVPETVLEPTETTTTEETETITDTQSKK